MTILASYLQLPELMALFRSAQNFWDILAAATGYDREVMRSRAKPLIYGIPFGMEQTTMARKAYQLEIPRLLEVPVIPRLIERRDQVYRQIDQSARCLPGQSLLDCLGSLHRYREISETEIQRLQPPYRYEHVRQNQYVAKNILACVIQSIELLIMGQLVPFFQQADVKAWLHDAIIYANDDPMLEAQMQAAVQSYALSFQPPIYTQLEFETL